MKIRKFVILLVVSSSACNMLVGRPPTPTPAPTASVPVSTPTAEVQPTSAGTPIPVTVLDHVPAEWRDFGDAPDGSPTDYLTGAAEGQFPSLAASGGPAHDPSRQFWLGEVVTAEGAAGSGVDAADDGVLFLTAEPCALSRVALTVNVSGIPAADRQGLLYVNLFADWNRDGRWEGRDLCTQEWAVNNFPIDLTDWNASTSYIFLAPQFIAGEQTDEFWFRVSLTREPMNGPTGAFSGGETEDYFYLNERAAASERGKVLAAPTRLPPTPPTPTFSCPGGMMQHDEWDHEFYIYQTFESRGRIVSAVSDISVDSIEGPPGLPPPVMDGLRIEGRRLDNGTYLIRLLALAFHPGDGPLRIEGPFTIKLRIKGQFEGAKKGDFEQQVACIYYVLHGDLLGNSWSEGVDGTFVGAPQDTSSSPKSAKRVANTFVKPHGKEFNIASPDPANHAGSYDEKSLRIFVGPEAGAANARTLEEFQKDGNDVKIAKAGRGLTFTTQKHGPEHTDVLFFIVKGTDATGKPITDIYRVFVNHCGKGGSPGGGLFRPTRLDLDDEVCNLIDTSLDGHEAPPPPTLPLTLRFSGVQGNVQNIATREPILEPQADILEARIADLENKTRITVVLGLPIDLLLRYQYSWAVLVSLRSKLNTTQSYILEIDNGVLKQGEMDPNTGNILNGDSGTVNPMMSGQFVAFDLPYRLLDVQTILVQAFNTPTMEQDGQKRYDQFVVPLVVTEDNHLIQYTGHLQVKTGETLQANFLVTDLVGSPIQGELFATLGNPPSRSDASHNHGLLDALGLINLPLPVKLPEGLNALFISWNQKVSPIAEINILPPCGGTCINPQP